MSIDDGMAEGRYRMEEADTLTPELTYEKRWAEDLLERVLTGLREECDADGRAGRFEVLEVYLVESKGTPPPPRKGESQRSAGEITAALSSRRDHHARGVRRHPKQPRDASRASGPGSC